MSRGWSPGTGEPTTLVLVRHGVTVMTADKRFSGGLGGSDPGLTDAGRQQVEAAADWLGPLAPDLTALVTSPVRRTRESADILAVRLGHTVETAPGLAEMEFGTWDGLAMDEVVAADRPGLERWAGSLDVRAGGRRGESFRQVRTRVLAELDRLLAAHGEGTVVAATHVTPIKVLVAHALGAPLGAVFRMELAPASVTVIAYYPQADGAPPRPSLRLYNARPPTDAPTLVPGTW